MTNLICQQCQEIQCECDDIFRDEDLIELQKYHNIKAYACAHQYDQHIGCVDVLNDEKFVGLIARMQAAEEGIYMEHQRNIHGQCMEDCERCKAVRRWEIAAGK